MKKAPPLGRGSILLLRWQYVDHDIGDGLNRGQDLLAHQLTDVTDVGHAATRPNSNRHVDPQGRAQVAGAHVFDADHAGHVLGGGNDEPGLLAVDGAMELLRFRCVRRNTMNEV